MLLLLLLKIANYLLGERFNVHRSETWATPGGHLEFGESPIQCATRELFEETGLKAIEVVPGPWTNDLFEAEDKHYLTLFMLVTSFEGEPVVKEPTKCLHWKRFSYDALPQPLFLPLANLFREQLFKPNLLPTSRLNTAEVNKWEFKR